MDRLVCGDVGFGKTEVALRAAFRVAMAGKQVAVLCPTTVLAQQHVASFQARLAPYPLRVEVLSRFVPKKRQAELVAGLRNGTIDVVIGTHRLLSRDVHFKQLGLLVVDEEHRFGVAHKERIKQLRAEVDVLTLSATPIPRTLHMSLGGLREMSLIATAPPDRRAVRTFVTGWDPRVLGEAIRRELSRGGQVFFVSSRIEDMYERSTLIAEIVPEARIATAHGRMRADVLERTMLDFVEGRYDILCCTAIVESGLDIPRANTMLIDRANRFGLAQLYQLRGRVGRARERGYCYLIVPPIDSLSDEARARVDAIERFSQLGAGFAIASLDMELRGAGDLLGAQQSGNLAAVGFELFTRMLEEAIAELRGLEVVHDVDPEIAVDVEHFLPDEYVDDVGLRLSFYKRLASAEDDESVQRIGGELEDRFGPPPLPARQLLRVMALKPRLRGLRALGCDATSRRVSLHLATDTPLQSDRLARLVAGSPHWQLAPEGTLTRRFGQEEDIDAVDRVESVLHELTGLAQPI
jgi:transcription-repair coupling factor (superfamily II helicase)